MITVNYLKSLEEEILEIYNKKPETKKDDMLLYYEYCYDKMYKYYCYHNPNLANINTINEKFSYIFIFDDDRKKFNISPYSAVERCARKIRERENKVDEIRNEMELVFKEYALDKNKGE